MTHFITPDAMIIDSRDVIARIETLRDEECPYMIGIGQPGCLYDTWDTYPTASDAITALREVLQARYDELEDDDRKAFAAEFETLDALLAAEEDDPNLPILFNFLRTKYVVKEDPNYEEDDELAFCRELEDELENHGDWNYGLTIIADEAFNDHARETIEECYSIPTEWPYSRLDWEGIVDDMKHDYHCFDAGGQTWWVRA